MSRTKDVNKPEVGQIDPDAATFEVTITKEENNLMQELWLKPEPLTENVTKEYRELEVAIYDLKTENNRLHEALDQVIEDRDAYHDENAELRKDEKRLEWLMSMVGWASTREDIDRMIGDEEE